MKEYDELLATVGALDVAKEVKDAILSRADAMNIELGKRGSDLMTTKKEKEELSKKNMTYKSFADSLSKYNLKAEDVQKLAEQAGIQKTNQETLDEYDRLLKTETSEKAKLAEELRVYKQKETLLPLFEKSLGEYKNKEGKEVKLLPDFVEGIKADLFKSIKEGDPDALIQDRINRALIQAENNQNVFLEKNGLTPSNTPIHKINEGGLGKVTTGNTGINIQEIKKSIIDSGGTVNSIAQAMAKVRLANQQK